MTQGHLQTTAGWAIPQHLGAHVQSAQKTVDRRVAMLATSTRYAFPVSPLAPNSACPYVRANSRFMYPNQRIHLTVLGPWRALQQCYHLHREHFGWWQVPEVELVPWTSNMRSRILLS